MDTPEPAMPILTLRDIFAFNQADLAQYLSEVQMEDGEDDLNGRGFGTLAGDHRGELPEGMSTPAPIPDHAPQSHPVSARGLAALLQFIADNNILPEVLAHPSFPGPSSPSPTPESDGDAVRKRFEIEAYHDLVRDGARPLYPIRLLDDVARDPERYRDLLRPLQDDPAASPPDWEVFQRQLERWRDFRRWQRDNRRIYDEDREFAEFLEQERRRLAKGKAQPGYAARTAAESATGTTTTTTTTTTTASIASPPSSPTRRRETSSAASPGPA
ncbi:hypothetical protein VTK73DRAFT_2660 [Phialemonium thermophilum]|uniref:Uncharacterized protein n=1 Tax=Phialemonium thermophilum TaxID=223376 RepID=A0ABR3VR45_9PEZI